MTFVIVIMTFVLPVVKKNSNLYSKKLSFRPANAQEGYMDCAVFSKRSSQPLKKQDEDVFGSGSENSVLDSEEFPSFAS
jgi:hypothetical protein